MSVTKNGNGRGATSTQDPMLEKLGQRLGMSATQARQVLTETIMPNQNATKEQLYAFVAVANEYGLNPILKEIYAFPAKGGGIIPIVGIDGWVKMVRAQPTFRGYTFRENRTDGGELLSVTCVMRVEGWDEPMEITEYLSECETAGQPWKTHPTRMLRHRSLAQAARYAFGFSGIYEESEAEQIRQAQRAESKPTGAGATTLEELEVQEGGAQAGAAELFVDPKKEAASPDSGMTDRDRLIADLVSEGMPESDAAAEADRILEDSKASEVAAAPTSDDPF